MKKKNKILGVMLCFAVGLLTFAVFKLNKITANAFTGESGHNIYFINDFYRSFFVGNFR